MSSLPKDHVFADCLGVKGLTDDKIKIYGSSDSLYHLKWFSEASTYNPHIFKNVPKLITMTHQLKIVDHC